jgi:hypothetical protein
MTHIPPFEDYLTFPFEYYKRVGNTIYLRNKHLEFNFEADQEYLKVFDHKYELNDFIMIFLPEMTRLN